MYVVDIVLVGVLAGLIVAFLSLNAVPRFRSWRTRSWVKKEIGEPTPELVERVERTLSMRRRRIGFGSLAGLIISVFVARPTWDLTSGSNSIGSVALTGAVLGLLVAVAVGAARDASAAAPPAGVRVALSTRPRSGWFMSRVGLAILGLAAANQLRDGYLRVAEAWRFDHGPTASTVLAIMAMGMLVLAWIATLAFLPWLASRPFFAPDEVGLRIEVALRRDLFFMITALQYPLITYVGLLVTDVDRANVPIEVRRANSDLMFGTGMLTTLLLLVGGIVLLRLTPRKPIRQLPPPQVSLRSSRASLR